MRRRTFVTLALALTAVSLTVLSGGRAEAQGRGSQWVFIGTYTGGNSPSKGIYRGSLDGSGRLTDVQLAAELTSPSFLAIHPSGKFLYAVNEVNEYEGTGGGAVTAFALDPATGELKKLNHQTTRGSGPCDLEVDPTGKFVVAANYNGGSVASIAIKADGSLGEVADFHQHAGSSVNPRRQEGPHAHAVEFDREKNRVLICDLGLDRVIVYNLDPATGKLEANNPAYASTSGGAGPRHVAIDPSRRFVYVNNELNSTVSLFQYDSGSGAMTESQTLSTLPGGYTENNSTAEIKVHPTGKFVYVSNRGHDSIAVFRADTGNGRLTAAGHQATLGRTPRNFEIDPTGRFLLAGNQNSDTIGVFSIDGETGGLTQIGEPVAAPRPVCVVFLAKP